MKCRVALLAFLLFPGIPRLGAQEADLPTVLSLRDQAAVREAWLMDRLQRLLPLLMRQENIDMWIIASREYNEDPIYHSMKPATWMAARRRTILVIYQPVSESGELGPQERLAVSRYDLGKFFKGVWDKEKQPNQWERLAEVIGNRDPKRIAINSHPVFALADGLSASEAKALESALPETYRDRLNTDHHLAVRWLETRTPLEMEVYPSICRIAHRIIAEGFSDQVIQPGVTTTADVQWWYRERIRGLGLETWFHPSVSLQRPQAGDPRTDFSSKPGAQVIHRGDLLHVDLGITYLGLNTDTQQHAYVLRNGESEAPQGLRTALKVGNQLQDILTGQFQAGRTGNEILAETLQEAEAQGIDALIYTHPLGFHGHAAGPTIGLWDQQEGVAGRGDYPLRPMTCYAIELSAGVSIPEWGDQEIRIMLEEDAFYDGTVVQYMDGRQTELLLVR